MRAPCIIVCLLLGAVSAKTVIQQAHDLHATTFTSLVAKAGLSHQLSSQGQINMSKFVNICIYTYTHGCVSIVRHLILHKIE